MNKSCFNCGNLNKDKIKYGTWKFAGRYVYGCNGTAHGYTWGFETCDERLEDGKCGSWVEVGSEKKKIIFSDDENQLKGQMTIDEWIGG